MASKRTSKKKKAQKKAKDEDKVDPVINEEDSLTFADSNVVMINGTALSFLMKDETLLKLFLTICNMSSLVIGSGIDAYQKAMLLRAINNFCKTGKHGTTMSIVSSPADKFMI